jgi:peptide/nickel transport system substrate-binding protein
MAQSLTRREFGMAAGAAALALGFEARAQGASATTLRFIAQSDLRVLDPVWTTAYITRNHGYMVFDALFAVDSKFKPHPQMVGDYNISPDQLRYSFTLRDGLKFHDGQPVRGADCVASLKRWMARDSFGQTLATAVDELTGGDGKSFTIRLKEPFPLLIDALAKVSSLVPFIMPERLAKTDPFQQVTEMVGSGPFKFVAEEFQPGHKVVYVKNTDYVPRSEPPDWASGGKVVRVDRVEWLNVPDAMTKVAALGAGEVDWWENPPLDMVPVLAANPEVTLTDIDPLGVMDMLRFNHLYPPFDNVKMREAVLAVVDQSDFMSAVAGDQKYWKICPSFFTCGTPMASNAGSTVLTGKRDFDKARKLIVEAGYHGEKIVVLDAVDQPNVHAQALVTADLLKKLGLNVELAASDWAIWSSAGRRKSRSTKAAGTSSVPGGSVPTNSIQHSIRRCGRMARRGSSGGRATTKSSRCGRSGSRPLIPRPARRSRHSCRNGPLKCCLTHPDRPLHAKDRVSQERQGDHSRPRALPMESREDLTVVRIPDRRTPSGPNHRAHVGIASSLCSSQ